MKSLPKALVASLVAAAVVSTCASYAAYQYRHRQGAGVNDTIILTPKTWDTILSPRSILCDCLVEVDTPSGKTTATPSVEFGAILLNTVYLFVPIALASALVIRRKVPGSSKKDR